jgi:hypothetical protein
MRILQAMLLSATLLLFIEWMGLRLKIKRGVRVVVLLTSGCTLFSVIVILVVRGS